MSFLQKIFFIIFLVFNGLALANAEIVVIDKTITNSSNTTTTITKSYNTDDLGNSTIDTSTSTPTKNNTTNIESSIEINNTDNESAKINKLAQTTSTNIFGNSDSAIVTLDDLGNSQDIELSDQQADGKGIRDFLLRVAESIKRIFYIIASVYFLIISIKLIVASNTEEELENFKKGIIWITIGLIVMNLAVYFVNAIYSPYKVEDTNATTFNLESFAEGLLINLINPIIKLLETATAFIFLLIAIFAFFRLVSANGDEEKAKKGKMTIVYAIIGFIVVVLAAELVFAVYGNCDGGYSQVAAILGAECKRNVDLSSTVQIIISIIQWMNSFVAVIVILMIIYAGAQIMFSGGNEEKVSNAKKSIIYIIIGIGILVINYFIITFFF